MIAGAAPMVNTILMVVDGSLQGESAIAARPRRTAV